MPSSLPLARLLPLVVEIVREAGQKAMAIYEQPFKVWEKEDESPLTEADLAANEHILDGLRRLQPTYPILSEENADIPWSERQHWETFWLVDPLDGTKEFVNRTGEFTVNVALVHRGQAVLGVVDAPAVGDCYFGAIGQGAYKVNAESMRAIHCKAPAEGATVRIVASKSHLDDKTRAFIESIPNSEFVQAGSSLKLCLLAEGKADLYPRLGPTSEWDIAAAQAVLEAAGGQVLKPKFSIAPHGHIALVVDTEGNCIGLHSMG